MVLLGSCAIPSASDIHLASCTRTCNATNRACLDESGVSCEPAKSCFDILELCFDKAHDCSNDCRDCEEDGSCTDEGECNYACEDLAHDCLNGIDECVDLQVSCAEGKADASLACVDTLLECVASCIEETEDTLKGK